MGYINKLFERKETRVIFSILWGLGLASLFKQVCEGRSCIQYKAPHPKDINGKFFKFNNECYTFNKKIVDCKGRNVLEHEEFH
tara:strand:+ start:34 stop:282 length:249 start_codon:yes stop_codon:yes gene_type:complete